ncbi:hypothetical protein [Rhizorhabdus argentea]|uniref:hypothetical protein n=1 Tax=Rhizorhabdus argentea TaxID=1387174 RepID=UPI0030EBE299
MGLFDRLTGGRKKRALAGGLLLRVQEPYLRFHNELICDVAAPEYGVAFEDAWMRFIRCRLDTPLALNDLPAGDLDMLGRVAARQSAAVRESFDEIRAAMELVLCNWPYRGLVRDCAKHCLGRLRRWDELGDPVSDDEPLYRTLLFFDIDMACSDICGELGKIAA